MVNGKAPKLLDSSSIQDESSIMKVYINSTYVYDEHILSDNMVSRNDATRYFDITLLVLFGYAFFFGTFISINTSHKINLVLVAILFFLCFPLGFIIDSPTFDFMMMALMGIISFILCDMTNLSRIVDALSASINEEVMPLSLKRVAITTGFFTCLVLSIQYCILYRLNKFSAVIGITIIYGIVIFSHCIISILGHKISRFVHAHPISASINEEVMSFMSKRIVIATSLIPSLLTFIISSSGVTVSTKIFFIYTVVAVTFCYLNQLIILSEAVVINENKTGKGQHFCSCASTNKSKDKCQRRSKSRCLVWLKPRSQDHDESLLYPKKLTIAVVYLLYIAISIFEACIVSLSLLIFRILV